MRFIFSLLIIIFMSGCAKLQHLDQLLTLKAFSDDQARQDKYVEKRDAKLKLLIEEVQNGKVRNYSSNKAIAKKFGEPIAVNRVSRDGQDLEVWVYRHTVKFFDSDKVYLYFDSNGKLIDAVFTPGKPVSTAQAVIK